MWITQEDCPVGSIQSESVAEKTPQFCCSLSSFGCFQWHLLSVCKQAGFIVFVHGGHWTGWTLRRSWRTMAAEILWQNKTEREGEARWPYLAIHRFKPLLLLSHTFSALCHSGSHWLPQSLWQFGDRERKGDNGYSQSLKIIKLIQNFHRMTKLTLRLQHCHNILLDSEQKYAKNKWNFIEVVKFIQLFCWCWLKLWPPCWRAQGVNSLQYCPVVGRSWLGEGATWWYVQHACCNLIPLKLSQTK